MKYLIIALVLIISNEAKAGQQDEFCYGFAQGFQAVRGGGVMVPMCPIATFPPLGTTYFQQGMRAGMQAAQ